MDDASTPADGKDADAAGSPSAGPDGAGSDEDRADVAGAEAPDGDEGSGADAAGDGPVVDPETEDLEALRAEVEAEYDFDNFGPSDMARMSPEEWDVSFDPETWTTGAALLDRVEDELKSRIASREVFAVLERVRETDGERVLAYSDAGYAIVYPDGTIEGRGTVLEDVKPTVALCSMPEYEPAEPPENYALPAPEEVPERSGELGNVVMQVVAALQLIAGIVLLGAWLFTDLSTLIAPTMALVFLAIAVFLFVTVANARLSDRFRSEEYRERLRSVQLERGERPDFVPIDAPAVDAEVNGAVGDDGANDGDAAPDADDDTAPGEGDGTPPRDDGDVSPGSTAGRKDTE